MKYYYYGYLKVKFKPKVKSNPRKQRRVIDKLC